MFRTELNIPPSEWKISLSSRVFSLGSCFAIHIGDLLAKYKFEALTNPFGTIFNPLSLFKLIQLSNDETKPEDWTFIKNQGVYRNYLFHSDISSTDKGELFKKIEISLAQTNAFLNRTDVVMLTFGTAIIYHLKENDQLVANCHKIPSQEFQKSFSSSDQIINSFGEVYSLLKKKNKNIKFIITVSPVRHLKDTLELNSLSKAILRVACGEILERFEDVDYFPSYELLIDDLRDYRFYKEDMLHPNEQAIKYVWEKFSEAYFDKETLNFLSGWDDILRAMNHKSFYPGSPEHLTFIKKTIKMVEGYKQMVDVSEELEVLRKQIELH